MWFQCSLSSGIPVYWQNLVWGSLAQIIPSMQLLMYTTGMARVVYAKLMYLNYKPKYTKTVVFISKACTPWCRSAHTFEEQNWYPRGGGGGGTSYNVGYNSQIFPSGIPVWCWCGAVSAKFFPVAFQCTLQVFTRLPSGIIVYTRSTNGIPVAFQCTLGQTMYTGSG